MGQPEIPPPEPPPSNSSKSVQKAASTIWEAAKEQWPILKPIAKWFGEEVAALKKGWVVFLVLTIVACVFVAWGVNENLQGRLKEKSDQVSTLKSDARESDKHHSDEIVRLKMDFYETNRQKDAVIALLTSDNDSLKSQVAMWMSSPSNMSATMGYFTNAITDAESWFPKLKLIMNGEPMTNDELVMLGTNRTIQFGVRNDSQVTAVNTTLDFVTPAALSETNLSFDRWEVMPVNAVGEHHWKWRADGPLSSNIVWNVGAIVISTNLQLHVCQVEVSIFSDRSKSQTYRFFLLVPQ